MSADRELVFGLLAFQNGLIKQETLFKAIRIWINDQSQTLNNILLQIGACSRDELDLLSRLVELHINKHGRDPNQSLASLSGLDQIVEELRQLGDPDICATLTFNSANVQTHDFAPKLLNPDQTLVHRAETTSATKYWSGKSRFRILRPHARGGLGEVFVALDQELNRDVALKEIQPKFADQADSRSRFMLEAEVTGGLEHPGIVPVYGLGQYEDGRPYYAMRFIQGDSLKEALELFHGASVKRQSITNESVPHPDSASNTVDYHGLDFRKLLGRFIDVCQAISYTHSRGVLHRDLKPGNIMLGKYGETLVVDWGLAKVLGRDESATNGTDASLTPSSSSGVSPTVMGSAIGTPAYMPPEQASGNHHELGPASDVYSLGATLFHLLTGQPPFNGRNMAQLLADVQSGNFPTPTALRPGIPKALEAICLKAMSLSPSNRYASAEHLADDIEKFLADEPTSAFIEPFILRAKRWVRKHQTLATTTAAVITVSAFGLIVFSTIVSGKNLELKSANHRLKESISREREVRQLAEANERAAKEQSQLALSTLTSVITDIQGGLSKVTGGGEVRRRLLKTSLEKVTSVSKQFLSHATLDHSTWLALIDMGEVILTFGANSNEVPTTRRTSLMGISTDQHPFDDRNEEQLTAVQLAEAYYRHALEIATTLASVNPNNEQYQRDLAISHDRLAHVLLRLNQADEALKQFELLSRHCQSLTEGDPNSAEKQRAPSIAFSRLGEVLLSLGHKDEAIVQFASELKISRALAAADPENAIKQRDHAMSHFDLGNARMAREEFELAEQSYEAGAKILRVMIERHLDEEQSSQELAELESAASNAKTLSLAFDDWESLTQQPIEQLPSLLEARGRQLTIRSRFMEAAQAARKLASLETASREQLYNAARVFGLCAASIQPTDDDQLSQEQSVQRQEWINEAIAVLRRAIADGFVDFDQMEQDSDLTVLRDQSEFRALIPTK